MFTPKKTIPKLAVAMFALTGCGGDGNGGTGGSGGSGATGGTGGTNGNGLSGALQAFCMKIAECYAGYTAQECVDFYNNGYLANYNLDANCEGALVSYFDCGTQLSCAEIMANSNSCDDEFYAIFDVCEPAM